jgi:hypothetical protein
MIAEQGDTVNGCDATTAAAGATAGNIIICYQFQDATGLVGTKNELT